MLYDSYVKAFNESDIDLPLSIHHEEFEATFHSTGKVMTKADMQAADTIAWMKSMSTDKSRCLYENDDILVIHQFVTYGSGDTDAVMSVFPRKDGLIWRAESGATPMPT